MDMYFRWSSSVQILFEPWQTFSWSWYLLSCIGVLALTIVLEATRFGFHRIHHQPQRRKGCQMILFKGKEVGVYAVYMTLSYVVMLVVMTFNVGLFVSVVLGHCIGMIFFPRNARQQSQFGTQQLYQQTTLDDSVNACH
jgi:copper transporter 1